MGILRIRDLNKGMALKQGDKTTLKFELYDANDDPLVLSSAGKVYFKQKGQVYAEEDVTITTENVVSFKLNTILPAGKYYIEFVVDDKVFPSQDIDTFHITSSVLGDDITVIEINGIDRVAGRALALIEDDLQAIEEAELTRVQAELARQEAEGKRGETYEKVKDLPEAFQNVIDETTGKDVISAPEIIAARRGKASLGEKIDEVTTQLAHKVYYFNTVNEMKNGNQLKVGGFVTTSGYHAGGDGGGANYLILDSITEDVDHYEALNNGLYASLTSIKEQGYVDVRWLGAKSDLDKSVTPHQGTDVAPYFEKALSITNKNLGMRIKVIGNYYWGTELIVYTDVNLFGEHNTNRTLTGTANNPTLRKKSPSEIYIDPSLQQAITLEGMGNTDSTGARSTHFTIEKLYTHSTGRTTNFLRITAYGAPSRPSWVQDLQAHALNYVFFFDYVEPRGVGGTHTYNFSVRGGCDIYSVNSLIKGNARNDNNPGLGGLSIFDNSIEWMDQGAVQAKSLFGYNRIENNLMEGSASNLDLTLGKCTLDVKGNYFEANSGDFTVIGASNSMSSLRMEDNYYLSDSTEYHLEGLRLRGYDTRIPKKQLAIAQAYVENPDWFIGLDPSKQKHKDFSYNNLRTTDLPLVDETTIQSNQFIIPMGNDYLTPNIKGKRLTGIHYATLPDNAPTIDDGDITIVCYYVTEGKFFHGYYNREYVSNGYGRVEDSSESKVFRVDVYHHNSEINQLRLLFRKVDGHDNVRVSDVLVTVLKESQRQEDLNKWLGVPHSNATN